jgi:hypothetical protein
MYSVSKVSAPDSVYEAISILWHWELSSSWPLRLSLLAMSDTCVCPASTLFSG